MPVDHSSGGKCDVTSGGVEETNKRHVGSEYCAEWLSAHIQIPTSINSSAREISPRPLFVKIGGERSSTKRCHRKGPYSAKKSSYLLSLFSDAEKMNYQRIQTNTRLETEQIHWKREILDAGAASNLPTASSGGLDVFYRSARRILPCSSVHETSHISMVLGVIPAFPIQGFPVRAQISPPNVFEMHGSGGSFPSQAEDIHISLSGRLAPEELVTCSASDSSIVLSSTTEQVGSLCQLQEIDLQSNTGSTTWVPPWIPQKQACVLRRRSYSQSTKNVTNCFTRNIPQSDRCHNCWDQWHHASS